MYPVADPQALFDPRPDRVEYAQMRAAIQPVYSYLSGSARTFATGSVGTVGIDTPVAVAVSGVPSTFYLGTPTVDTPPSATFLDTFTGAAGPLSGHTADTGQSWINASGSTQGLTELQLTGFGELRATGASFKAAGVNLNLTTGTITITVDAVVSSLALNITSYFYIANNLASPGASTYTRFMVACLQSGLWRTSITDNAGSTFNVDVPGGNFGIGTRTFTFVINGSGKAVYLGTTSGTLVATRTQVSTFTNAGLVLETLPNLGTIGVSSIYIP